MPAVDVGGPSLADRLLGREPHQRLRLLQSVLALVLTGVGAAAMMGLVAAGIVAARPALWWAAVTIASFAGFVLAIRLGWNLRVGETPFLGGQIAVAFACGAWAYALAGPGRGAVLPAPVVALMFGLPVLPPPLLRRLAWLATALFALTMAGMAWLAPALYPPAVEGVHFLMLAALLQSVPAIAAPLAAVRTRVRGQQAALREARARIADLAIRDELTGLANRRYAQELLMLEHERCMRSGHPFCVARIDLDHHQGVSEAQGAPAGDALLRRFADEARDSIRISDVLARWDGPSFMLIMTNTRGALGRLGVDRLRDRVARLPAPVDGAPLRLAFSAGVAEHRAGEALERTLERADEALAVARSQGRNRVILR